MKLTQNKLVLFNSSILTNYGIYDYRPVSMSEARSLVQTFQRRSIESAIGHQATAELLSEVLDFDVQVSRLEFKQEVGEVALIFKLKHRPPEGKILSRADIEEVGYEFGLLTRIE